MVHTGLTHYVTSALAQIQALEHLEALKKKVTFAGLWYLTACKPLLDIWHKFLNFTEVLDKRSFTLHLTGNSNLKIKYSTPDPNPIRIDNSLRGISAVYK